MSHETGWIGVDLDGTLAFYNGWNDGLIGAPIPAMVERVKAWLAAGKTVKVFTARISGLSPTELDFEWRKIRQWCRDHIGVSLPITCEKDRSMIELWDDRAVQVIPNTGERADGREVHA